MAKKKVKKASTKKPAKKATATASKKKTVKKKTVKKKPTRKKKTASDVRKRLIWGVFNSSMKEEGRFPYDQRKEAEKKLQQLQAKSKKPYFIQPIKEVLAEVAKVVADDEDNPPKPKRKKRGEEE